MSSADAGESIGAVVVAAGAGTRFGRPDKVLELLGGRPILQYSLELFERDLQFDEVVVVLGEHTLDAGRDLIARMDLQRTRATRGGSTRAESVRAGIAEINPETAFVAVHDAARPLATRDLVNRLITVAMAEGAAAPGLPLSDTVHAVDSSEHLEDLLDRDRLRAVQTPQIARRDWLVDCYRKQAVGTDESTLLFRTGYPVAIVPGDPQNVKLTWQFDLAVAEAILAAQEVAG